MVAEIVVKVLLNGMTLIIAPNHVLPKVSMCLFYRVGSKHESLEEKNTGIAHLIEHMIFKGTDKLVEGELDACVHTLSGSCNAFTSYDYTGYVFDLPVQHYKQILPIMADCMTGCKFNQEYLNSELKAVIQELKMYQDDSNSILFSEGMKHLFKDHPYSNPIIGLKEHVWSKKSADLRKFYDAHYSPDNAILVVSGDVNPDDVYHSVVDNFEHISKRKSFFENNNVKNNSGPSLLNDSSEDVVTISHDIQESQMLMMWKLPAQKSLLHIKAHDLLAAMIGSGKSSFLYQKFFYEYGLVYDIDAFFYDFHDYYVINVLCKPKEGVNLQELKDKIISELKLFSELNSIDQYFNKALRNVDMASLSIAEDPHRMAYCIGQTYMLLEKVHTISDYNSISRDELKAAVLDLLKSFPQAPSISVAIVKATEEEKEKLMQEREKIDAHDQHVLDSIVREVYNEPYKNIHTVKTEKPYSRSFPHFLKKEFDNGLVLYTIPLETTEKIEFYIDFKSKHFMDQSDKLGRQALLFDLMEEGTRKYKGKRFALEIESYGIEFSTGPGYISCSCLPEDFEKACDLIAEYILHPELDADNFALVKDQMLSEIREFWDDAPSFSRQLVREAVYQKHPYGKNPSGTLETVSLLTLDDIKSAYDDYIVPEKTVFAVAGKIDHERVFQCLSKYFSQWQGKCMVKGDEFSLPLLKDSFALKYFINRDQAVVSLASPSIMRFDKNYDKYLIMDQIFGGGILNSMKSRLFALRQKTGMFYNIGGTMLAGCGEYPGMMYVRAITNPGLVDKALVLIKDMMSDWIDNVTDSEYQEAQNALANNLHESYGTAANIVSTVAFMHRHDIEPKYFENRIDSLYEIKKEDAQEIVKSFFVQAPLVTLVAGRV